MNQPQRRPIALSEAQLKARSQRNVAIAVAVAGLCALFYAVTLVKLGFAGVPRP